MLDISPCQLMVHQALINAQGWCRDDLKSVIFCEKQQRETRENMSQKEKMKLYLFLYLPTL